MQKVILMGIITGLLVGMTASPTKAAELDTTEREGELWVTVTGKLMLVDMTAVVGAWQEYAVKLSDGEICILIGELVKKLEGLENREVTITGVLKPRMRCKGELTRTIEIRSIDKVGEISKVEKGGKIVSVEGRLTLEMHGKEEWLILHSKDAMTYVIRGEFVEKLKDLLLNLGENNLISVTGLLREGYDISIKTKYGFDEEDRRTLDARAIRLYHLKVTQINDAKKSKEEIPPPERDAVEEAKARESALARISRENTAVRAIRNIQGKISSLNLRTPIKTIEISSRDRNKVLLLSSESRITKKVADAEEPMFLGLNSLREDQEVYVEYLEDEYKPEALFITILKE